MSKTTRTNRLIERERVWGLAKVMNIFTAHDLSADSKRSLEYCRDLIKDWVRYGYAAQMPERHRGRLRFRITDKTGTPPMTGRDGETIRWGATAEGNMWRAMRMLRTFNPRDVAMHANTGDVDVTEQVATRYCQALARAGYLRVDVKASPGKRPATYGLLRNTGPKAPRETRIRAIKDDNLGQITYAEGLV